jgi:hypothetical protein
MIGSRLDLRFVRTMMAAHSAELAVALLGEPNHTMSSKRELRFGRKGSLAVQIAGSKAGLWHDHELGAGGDMFGLIMRERGGSFKDAIEFAEQFVGQAPREPVPASQVRSRPRRAEENIQVALRIWEEAVPIAGTLAEAYLTRPRSEGGRGITELPPGIDGTILAISSILPMRARASALHDRVDARHPHQ